MNGTPELFNYPGVFYFNQPNIIYDKTTWSIDVTKVQELTKYHLDLRWQFDYVRDKLLKTNLLE